MKLVSVKEMRAIEKEADEKGTSYETMMERAGLGVAERIHHNYGADEPRIVIALVGSGNNGGDALVALEHLAKFGWKVNAYLAKPRDDDPLVSRVSSVGGQLSVWERDEDHEQLNAWLTETSVLVDGLLGTGISLPLRSPYDEILTAVKQVEHLFHIVAVDCPSGVDCDSGEAPEFCLKADLTVCMQAIKIGLLDFPAYQYVGRLDVVDLELPENLETEKTVLREVATAECVRRLLPQRPLQSHKGTFGTALIVAGSINYTGAAYLSGQAAYRIGAGLVQMAVPGPIYTSLSGSFPEAIWLLLPHEQGVIQADSAALIQQNLDKATSILFGPGWGREETTREFLERIISGRSQSQKKKSGIGFVMMDAEDETASAIELPPAVIDADGLRMLVQIKDWHQKLPRQSILTPHPGELAAMTELTVNEIQNHRLEIGKEFSNKWGHVLVLKGAMTVVSAPDGRQTIIPVATPALARAGTGDVLSGIIAGLLAQGKSPYEAAVAGVWIHGQAGLEACETVGHPAAVLASDVLNAISGVLSRLG